MKSSLRKIEDIIKLKKGKIINYIDDPFSKSKFECEKGHLFEIYPNDVIIGDWCNECLKTFSKIEIILNELGLDFEKKEEDYLVLKKFLITYNEEKESIYNIIYIIDEDELSKNKLWEIFKEGKKKSYIKKKFDHECISEEILKNGNSVIKKNINEIPKDRIICYGYLRVSTYSQVDKHSLNNQESLISKHSKNNNYFLKALYLDKGISGGKMEGRLALQRLLKEIKEGDRIIISSLSRLGRNTREFLEMVDIFDKKGVNLIILDLNLNTKDASGRLVLTMLSSQAQFERELTSERVKSIMKHLKDTGKLRTKPRYGLKLAPLGEEDMFIRDENEQKIIQEIRELWKNNNGMGITSFTRLVNQNIKPIRKSKIWYHGTLKRLMIQEGMLKK